MTVSVVIPAYNEEKYLPKTLESIGKLDRKPDEVVVIDGNSTDRTSEVAKEHGAKCIVVEHRGIGYARQKGVENALGDIIAFTDADTLVPHDWLTNIIHALEKEGVVGVYGGFSVVDGWLPYRILINYIQPVVLEFYHLIGVPMAAGQNTAFWKSKALEAGGYPIEFKVAEDTEMARRLKKVGKVVFLRHNPVLSSGRRGNEGFPFFWRLFKSFIIYFVTRRADKLGFPDMR